MAKKLLIVSHERSGTHWLMDTITSNFFMPDPCVIPARIDLDEPGVMYADPVEMKKFLQFLPSGAPLDDVPFAHPFKSHHVYEFFAPIWDYVISQYHVFYIARDGRDVMTSFWRHCWKTTGTGPRAINPTRFMLAVPGIPQDRRHGDYSPVSMADRWSYHIESWMAQRIPGVFYITYEEMHEDFAGVVKDIGRYMGSKPAGRIYLPKLGGIDPWKGVTGSWEGLLDESLFWPDGQRGMKLLGYEAPRLVPQREANLCQT